jgi:hypothetical protein
VMKMPAVAASYLVVAVFLFLCSKKESLSEAPDAEVDADSAEPQPA